LEKGGDFGKSLATFEVEVEGMEGVVGLKLHIRKKKGYQKKT
jgi:hypothetical protein